MDLLDLFQSAPYALQFSLLAALVTFLGLLWAAFSKKWLNQHMGLAIGFAAGALITTSFLHLLPETAHQIDEHGQLGGFIFVGFLIGMALNRLVQDLHPARDLGDHSGSLVTAIIGIALHSFADGFAYTTTFATDFHLGLFTSVGLILHELPEGLIIFAMMRAMGHSKTLSLIVAFFVAAVTTPWVCWWPCRSSIIFRRACSALLSLSLPV